MLEELREAAARRWAQRLAEPCFLVGTATCGRAAGALQTAQAMREEGARVIEVGCLGHCYAEPLVVARISGLPPLLYGNVTPAVGRLLARDLPQGELHLEWLLGALEPNELLPTVWELPRFRERRVLLRRCGLIDPQDIDAYLAEGGYSALALALSRDPEEVIEAIVRSGLRGRGGAGFPTGRKWELCRRAPREPKYVICNADEGDPGAFMDRCLLESDPHAVLEGMVIAAWAVGSHQGYVYVRAEYPLAVQRIRLAIEQAGQRGILGPSVLGTGFRFEVEVVEGAGAFVCGESSALMYSLEGRRGMPRLRPPHSTEEGLWRQPTVLNNVKTFAFVPYILAEGPEAFARIGPPHSPGTAMFALAGKVVGTGLVEVPMGTTLRELILEIAGGVPGGKRFKAVQIGGPSGGCLPEQLLDLTVDFDSLQGAGAMMGSGGMVVMDEEDCMVDVARYFLEFTQRESCGKCTFCRLGTKQMLMILEDITEGRATLQDLQLLEELAEDVRDGALCGLGRTAPNPVLSTLRHFRSEYEAHVLEGRCPALKCPALIAYYILPERCERSCDACVGSCPVEAIFTGRRGIKVIDQGKCVKCASCLTACPPQYRAVVKLSPPSEVPPCRT